MTCSPVQTLSKPACSAAFATAAAVFGDAHGPLLMLNSPNFIRRSYHEISYGSNLDVVLICRSTSKGDSAAEICACKDVQLMSHVIQMRNVPDALHRKLKARAARAECRFLLIC